MKKIFLGVAVLAMLAGCSKNEVTDVNPTAPDMISFSASTSRATVTTIADAGFQNGGTGFSVWATANNVPGWYEGINGMSHIKTAGVWNFSPTPIAWPTVLTDYPMNFYAVYPTTTVQATNPNINVPNTSPAIPAAFNASSFTIAANGGTDDGGVGKNDQALSFTYVVQPSKLTQVDLLAAHNMTSLKPSGSNLSLTFDHLLSKINFMVDVEANMNLKIQGITVNNVGNTGVYTFIGASTGWTTQPSVFDEDYTYYGRIYPTATTGHTTEIVLGSRTLTSATTDIFLNADSIKYKNLMLMPQVDGTRKLTITSNKLVETPTADGDIVGKSFVTVMYRLQHNSGRLVGYENANEHPAYRIPDTGAGETEASVNGIYATNGPLSSLFVKAVFPFELNWEQGKGYLYVIPFNTSSATGGYLVDQNYYDEAGNRTNLVVGDSDGDGVPEYPKVKDPILQSDGYIHLIPVVTNWDDPAGGIDMN